MKTLTLERYLNEPETDLRLHAAARRERAALMGRLAGSLLGRLAPRPEPAHWLAQLG